MLLASRFWPRGAYSRWRQSTQQHPVETPARLALADVADDALGADDAGADGDVARGAADDAGAGRADGDDALGSPRLMTLMSLVLVALLMLQALDAQKPSL